MTHTFTVSAGTVTASGLTSIEGTCGHGLWAGFGSCLTRHVIFRTVSFLSLRFSSCKWHHNPGLRGTYGSTQAGSGKGAWCQSTHTCPLPPPPPGEGLSLEAARLSSLCLQEEQPVPRTAEGGWGLGAGGEPGRATEFLCSTRGPVPCPRHRRGGSAYDYLARAPRNKGRAEGRR